MQRQCMKYKVNRHLFQLSLISRQVLINKCTWLLIKCEHLYNSWHFGNLYSSVNTMPTGRDFTNHHTALILASSQSGKVIRPFPSIWSWSFYFEKDYSQDENFLAKLSRNGSLEVPERLWVRLCEYSEKSKTKTKQAYIRLYRPQLAC